MEHIPIPKVVSGATQMNVVDLVDKILQLHKKLLTTDENSNEWERLKSEIKKTDEGINEQVRELYGIAPDEALTIEGD